MHTFHIPVMGIGYTIDTPVRVAPYGISSVISLFDDILIEKMRKHYCTKLDMPYKEITNKDDDHRAKRITEYLNIVDKMVKEKFADIKKSTEELGKDFRKYMEMLPDMSPVKQKFNEFISDLSKKKENLSWILNNIKTGEIDVNIMTKADKTNFKNGEPLENKYNDAHAAIRGFANSTLNSSVVLSAGMNQRLFAYMAEHQDFFPDENGNIKKKIILKVSDYRSALIQGKLLAKRGLWVSEFRIESGLNCGGHAFPTQGFLFGPILDEFKSKREELINSIYTTIPENFRQNLKPELRISAQGGVGNNSEHEFLLEQYILNSIGWGSPFLLVPEVCNITEETIDLLISSQREDYYTSYTSPMGVPFNTVRNNTKDIEKAKWIKEGTPGSHCPKHYGAINQERMCLSSRKYQMLKIDELKSQNLSEKEYNTEFNRITEKTCICVGLGTTALMVNGIDTKVEGNAVSVCPGPNLSFFKKKSTLKEMTDHIYNRTNLLAGVDRPNLFLNELEIYVNYLEKEVNQAEKPIPTKLSEYYSTFKSNLLTGIEYYSELFKTKKADFLKNSTESLNKYKAKLNKLVIE